MATESYEDDDLLLPLPEEAPSSPVFLKLKRLKKSSKSSPNPPIGVSGAGPVVPMADYGYGLPDDVLDPLFSVPAADEGFETLDLEVEEVEEKKEKPARKRLSMEEEGKEEEASEKKKKKKKKRNSSEELARGRRRMEMERQARFEQIRVSDGAPDVPISDLPDDGLDPLFLVPAADEGFETLDLEEQATKKMKSARKRLSMEEEEEEVSKKKKKTNKRRSSSEEPAREKKRMEKERQARLEQIHAESQRLLRETRNASFKPVPLVQKPISSVLEKIRLRKLEVLKRSGVLVESDHLVNEIVERCEPNLSQAEERDSDGDVLVEDHVNVEGVESGGRPLDPCGSIPCNNDSLAKLNGASTSTNEREDSVVELNVASHTSTNERENVAKSSKPTDDNQLNDLEDSSDADLPTSNINHDRDNLSSEEDAEKENIAPHISDTVNMDSSPSCGLAKAFIDDEAEEEDDSDHDITRFQENEEEDESDENDLHDLIATGYEEATVDKEKRNELHQKWLEQQDAAGTDNLLQKLHCGQREREPTSFDEDSDESGEEYDDEESNDLPVTSVVRQNAKKAKQMIAQMFTDGDDMYVPSDDEESEQTLMRQRVLKQSGESSFISPVEDEHSREVFGLIKKLNVAPTTKRRGKITSSFDTLVGNSNSSSKTSFLNRTSSNSLQSLRKQGSATMRTFIFSRDDSNSMSSIQASEKISETDLKENQPSRAGGASTKIKSCSQFKSSASKATATTNSSSGASLFEILRHSSLHFNGQLKNNKGISSHEITESQASYQFSAFNLRTRK